MNKALLSKRIIVPLLFTFFSIHLSFGQQTVGKETLAIDYFHQGDFEKALPIFAKLAQSYPDNAMYNYYYGVSLIKNNIFETAAKEALLNSVVDKTPVNANFYLGNYFHALEQWGEAMDFYDRYEKVGTKQEKKSLKLTSFVDLCQKKVNPFKPKKSTDSTLFGDAMLKPPPSIDEKSFPIPEALKNATFNFQVNELLAYHRISDFRSEASKILFTKAWMCTGMNDSILVLTDSLRKVHDQIARVDTRLGLVQQIVDGEQKSFQLMRDREKFLEQSRVKESAFWDKEGKKEAMLYNNSILARENKITAVKNPEPKSHEIPQLPVVKTDSVPATDQQARVVPEKVPAKSAPAENILFKVQVGAFKNGVISQLFKKAYTKVSKLRKIDKFTDPKKFAVYTVGNFKHYADATKMKDQLLLEGMKGAFVIAYQNGLKIPVTQALKITGGN